MKTSQDLKAEALNAILGLSTPAKLDGNPEAIAALRDIALRAIGILDNLTCHTPGHPDTPEAIRLAVDTAHEVAARSFNWPVSWNAIQEIREPHLGKIHKDKKTDGTGRVGKLRIGRKLGIRTDGNARGRPREFDGLSGFGLDVWQELEAERVNPRRQAHAADIHPELAAPGVLTDDYLRRDWKQLAALLEPLSSDSLETWVAAGAKLCESWTEEWRLENHPTIPDLPKIRKIPRWNRFPWIESIKSKATETQQGTRGLRGAKATIPGKIRSALKSILPV